jgi:hypothetical protein
MAEHRSAMKAIRSDKIKVKVKLSHEGVLGSGGIAALIL